MKHKLPILSFESAAELRQWLEKHHATSEGIWLRIYKTSSGIKSVAFLEVLDEGLCFGWSESMRVKGDESSYLQQFTPRRAKGTSSKRNHERALQLIKQKRMTSTGLEALGMK